MKLIIDIPEEMYAQINEDGIDTMLISYKDIIKNGTPILDNATTADDVLDKIRAEIDAIETHGQIDEHTLFVRGAEEVKNMVLEIIDKYRTVKGANE